MELVIARNQGHFEPANNYQRYIVLHCGTRKHTPTSVRRRSSRVDFRLRNPSSPDVVFVMKALFSILDPQNRVETNTCFVFAHDFVLAVRYCFFFSLLTFITDSTKFLRCLPFTDGRLQLQHSNTSTKSVKRRILKHRKWRGKINDTVDELPDN